MGTVPTNRSAARKASDAAAAAVMAVAGREALCRVALLPISALA